MKKSIVLIYFITLSFSTAYAKVSEYAIQAMTLMQKEGRAIAPSRSLLERVSNIHQVDAIRTFLDSEMQYRISDKMPFILQIHNEYQTKALQLMVEARRNVSPFLQSTLNFENSLQLDALEILLNSEIYLYIDKHYHLSEILPFVTQIKNEIQVETLKLIVDDNRDVSLLLQSILKFDNISQLNAVKTLIMGDTKYTLLDKMSFILQITNSFQVDALKLMVNDNKDVKPFLQDILKLKNRYQIAALRILIAEEYKLNPLLPKLEDINTQEQVDIVKSITRERKPLTSANLELIRSKKNLDINLCIQFL